MCLSTVLAEYTMNEVGRVKQEARTIAIFGRLHRIIKVILFFNNVRKFYSTILSCLHMFGDHNYTIWMWIDGAHHHFLL